MFTSLIGVCQESGLPASHDRTTSVYVQDGEGEREGVWSQNAILTFNLISNVSPVCFFLNDHLPKIHV